MKQWNHDMADHINKMGYDPNDIEGFKKLDEEEVKRLNLESFVKHSPICTELIRNKICLLFKSSASHPLYISDNPVTMHNDENFGAYENIGFTALGIQIYLPISSILSIGFWCPTIQRKFEESWAEFERLEKEVKTNLLLNPNADREQLNNILKFFEKERQKHANFVKNAAEGTPIEIPPETVTLLNSLQVKWSYRFVMCEKNDFDLVKRMLNDNEGYREGAKIGIN